MSYMLLIHEPVGQRATRTEAEGRAVTTIEGLSRDRSHPVQQALVAEQAIQCGFCTPGIAISAAALLMRNADPSEADIKAAVERYLPKDRRVELSVVPGDKK